MKKIYITSIILGMLLMTACGSEAVANQKEHLNSESSEESVINSEINTESEFIMTTETETETMVVEKEPVEETFELSMIAVGDNLIHTPIYTKAKQSDGSYDFHYAYENIKNTIQKYDLAVINQETIFVDSDNKISSYPCFGTPQSMGEALMDTGFNIVLSATNHTWDKGKYGWETTLNYWSNYPEITLLGINKDEDDFNTVDIVEKNGFKFAMFNYTYGMNGFKLPSDMQYAVNLLDYKDKFIDDIKSVKDSVDITICFVHIGNEYVYTPTSYQVNYINDLIDAGADIVICAHPHVVEPYGVIETPNGNKGLVYYSCGNFISAQVEIPRVLGGMAEIQFKKTVVDGETTSCEVVSYDFEPVVCHWNSKEHTVYLLSDYTDELAKKHYLAKKGLTVNKLEQLWDKIINTGE